MTMMKRIFGGTVAMAALATAAPAAAQYGYPYGYGYGGYNMTQVAAQQCTAAVNNRLYSRGGLSGIIGSLFGVSGTSPRVLSVTQVNPRRSSIRVTGLASSGRYAYNPYGYGYYGALGAGYAADLRFRCDVDYRGFVRNVDIDRR
ncbi:MAG TPA: hypothetical protein VFU80_02825 [Sphingomicrobium sp.]|nr:hypothetical protein [Sphingomicrobium sp.]